MRKLRDFFPCSLEFDTRMPSEEKFSTYFRFLRQDKGFSTSTLWTTYSMLNSVCKGKSPQQYPRLQSIIKVFDVDVKRRHTFLQRRNRRIWQDWDYLRSILACSETFGYYRLFRRTPSHWGHELGSGKNRYWTRRGLCGSWTCQTKIGPAKFQVIFNIIQIVVKNSKFPIFCKNVCLLFHIYIKCILVSYSSEQGNLLQAFS